jgi:hypothetical protein
LTPPDSVNVNAFESRFLITCCSRCSSVSVAGGTFAPRTSPAVGSAAGEGHVRVNQVGYPLAADKRAYLMASVPRPARRSR